MSYNNSFISLKEVISGWSMKRSKHANSRWKSYLLAGEAVQKLAYMSMPMIEHKLITRTPGQTWFDLPDDLNEVVSIGVRTGDSWRAIGYSRQLMGMPAYSGPNDADLDPASFTGPDLNTWGNQQTWYAPPAPKQPHFNSSHFIYNNFLTAAAPQATQPMNWWGQYMQGIHARMDNVVVDLVHRQILTTMEFPGDEIYLVYMGGIQSLDSMTRLPLYSVPAIEAFIDWKWIKYRRGGAKESAAEEINWNHEHKILRALVRPLFTTDIKHILTEYGRLGAEPGMNTNLVTGNPPAPSTPSVTGVAEWVSVPTNPYPGLLTADPYTYTGQVNIIAPTANFAIDAHLHPTGQYLIIRWPDTFQTKTRWDESFTFNINVPIPGIQFPYLFQANGYWYAVSRAATFSNNPQARVLLHN